MASNQNGANQHQVTHRHIHTVSARHENFHHHFQSPTLFSQRQCTKDSQKKEAGNRKIKR